MISITFFGRKRERIKFQIIFRSLFFGSPNGLNNVSEKSISSVSNIKVSETKRVC